MPKKKPEAPCRCLVVFSSVKSITDNARLGLSYEWSSKPCKRNCPFIGLYDKKTIEYVGKVEAITVASYSDGAVVCTEEAGRLTDDHRRRITSAVEETRYYDLKDGKSRRFYLVDSFFRTNAIKPSPGGGIRTCKYFDLSDFDLSKSVAYDPHKDCKDYTSEELAATLKGAFWK
jgi:hypothetical protein